MYRISNGAFAGCAAVIVAKPLPNLVDKLWFSG
jgi:hypothetical protein